MQAEYSGPWDPASDLPAAFLDLPDQVYRDHSAWIPEVKDSLRYMFSPLNKYFSVGQVWLGVNDNARLAGFIAPHQQIDGKLAAYFGYWEGHNDPAAHKALFADFEQWARENKAEVIYGPINFSTYGMYRIRIDSFSASQFIGEPYNPSYYPALLDALGYRVCKQYGTSFVSSLEKAAQANQVYVDRLREAIESEYVIKPVTTDYWLENIEELYGLSLEIFAANFAYTPISLEDFKKACGKSFADKICQHSSLAAETREGEIAAMMLSFPDYSPLVRQAADTGITPDNVSFTEHLDRLERPKTLLLKTAGVSDKHRGKHLYTYLFNLCTVLGAAHYEQALSCLFILDNPSRKAADRMSQDLRHYGLYRKEL